MRAAQICYYKEKSTHVLTFHVIQGLFIEILTYTPQTVKSLKMNSNKNVLHFEKLIRFIRIFPYEDQQYHHKVKMVYLIYILYKNMNLNKY